MTKSPVQMISDILEVRSATPHDVLGMHKTDKGVVVRAFVINAASCEVVDVKDEMTVRYPMKRIDESGFYEVEIPNRAPFAYRLRTQSYGGEVRQFYDAYNFLPTLSEDDLYLIGKGDEHKIYDKLGSHIKVYGEIRGTAFTVWAPTARRVSLVGDFNEWDGRYHQMRRLGSSGIWEIFMPGLMPGTKYKYEILPEASDTPFLKTDPYAIRFEPAPHNAAIVCDLSKYKWGDSKWIENRAKTDWKIKPISIYEVHLGSWKCVPTDGFRPLQYREIADELIAYCKEMNFTHVEFLPLTEFPFDGSWGYQVTGFYAPTQRYGSPHDFMAMIDKFHQNGIGVIMDWVPGHFPRDFFALARFDGSFLYEHADPRQGEQQDWGTLVFNYGRHEVMNFLIGSALAWMERFHIDGLRVDAVASMLYLDFSRKSGEWVPNKYGGRENLDAIEFLKRTNVLTKKYFPGTIMIAEESTAFPNLTKPVSEGGLGFDFKWDMGWMHDTLSYLKEDPINRKFNHNKITFPSIYQFSENFILIYSHDEVVHGKSSMLNKMGGAYWGDKIANLRALYAYMWMWPGKKTLFMGSEFGQTREWKYDESLDWHFVDYPEHAGIRKLVSDVAGIYLKDKALAENDFVEKSFSWINPHDGDNSVISFLRYAADHCYAIVCNFTPIARHNYRIGLPYHGNWTEILNSDSEIYGGSGQGNKGTIKAEKRSSDGFENSADIFLPPMSTVVFRAKVKPPACTQICLT